MNISPQQSFPLGRSSLPLSSSDQLKLEDNISSSPFITHSGKMSIISSQGSSGAAAPKSLGLLLCVLVLAQYVEAATVNVGGSSGWTLGVNYKTWATNTRVKPWDNLFFKYDPRIHNVLLVSKADFDACKISSPWATYKSGKDYVKFTKTGTYYLICGVASHCAAGMKVAVNVHW